MSNSKKDKSQLTDHLYAVLNTEIDKPYEEIDAELIEACVELILELQGKNFTLSNEEIEEKVRKIPFIEVADFEAAQKKRKKLKKKKILLIAAIIAVLCAILAVISSGDKWDFLDYFEDKYGDAAYAPLNEPFTIADEEYIFVESSPDYTDPKEFYEKEGHNILFPTELPEGIEFNFMCIVEKEVDCVVIYMSGIEGFSVDIGCQVPQFTKDVADKTYITENGIVCYILYSDNPDGTCSIQIEFEYDGNYYTVTGIDNEQALLDIIESLEEIA